MSRVAVPTNGAAIRKARQLAGYRSGQFARRIGITHGHLSCVENGRKNASPDLLRRIAAETGKRIDDFVDPSFLTAA